MIFWAIFGILNAAAIWFMLWLCGRPNYPARSLMDDLFWGAMFVLLVADLIAGVVHRL